MDAYELDTPCLLLDLGAVEHNSATMMASLAGSGVALRPHFKTPKCPQVARMQLDAGAIGITVAKLGEAEVLADAGLGPILMANQVVGPIKIARLMALLARKVDITIALESEFNVRELSEGARLSGQRPAAVIEVDAGMSRCGTSTPAETVALARMLVDAGIDYRGIMGYEGHMYAQPDEEPRRQLIEAALGAVNRHAEALAEAVLPPRIVSTSGSASTGIASRTAGITELQAGTYIFHDSHHEGFTPGIYQYALTLLTTVVTVRDRYAVCDAGMKSLSSDHGPSFSRDGSFKAARLSEEHAHLTGPGIAALHPGQKVELVPSHGDTTLNLHDVYHVVRKGQVVDEWPILGARRFK